MELTKEITPKQQPRPLLERMGIEERPSGEPIGTLILCGQGPVQDARTAVKISELEKVIPGSTREAQANTWMRLIARAAGELDKEGDVGLIIPSGKATGGSFEKEGAKVEVTEADLMRQIIESVYGNINPQSKERYAQAQVELETEAKNTLFNVINAANIIDQKREANPNDPNLDNVWLIGSHFHTSRIKVLASLFGFDPNHVLSAEEVLMAGSKIEEADVIKRGQLSPDGFNKQKALQELLKVRIEGRPVTEEEEGMDYFERAKLRKESNLDRIISDYLKEQGVPETEMGQRFQEIKTKLYIEEQKSAQMRMMDERRWVRGLATEIDYVLPLAGNLKSNDRLRNFLLKFDQSQLDKYEIDRKVLESVSEDNLDSIMAGIREKIDPNRWRWQVVKEEWRNEEYPREVMGRFLELGIPDEDIGYLSRAEVPPLKENL